MRERERERGSELLGPREHNGLESGKQMGSVYFTCALVLLENEVSLITFRSWRNKVDVMIILLNIWVNFPWYCRDAYKDAKSEYKLQVSFLLKSVLICMVLPETTRWSYWKTQNIRLACVCLNH